jgi:CxxC-x17-CxxC domain-containing protein
MQDKIIRCKDCGADFVFSEKDQLFYKEKGFDNEPQRCPECRAAKKAQSRSGDRGGFGGGYGGGGGNRGEREMFPAVCARCGKQTTVPFRPSGDKPVYCKDCFQPRNRF